MKVILFGATGMVGQGALRECENDPNVTAVLAIVRTPFAPRSTKVTPLVHADFFDFRSVESALTGYDACFFCLGVSSVGMSESAYHRVTHDLTLAAAQTLARLNPGMCFVFVSGQGTDRTEKGGSMWARVKGKTENDLLRLPFKAAYLFRPGFIQPLHGIRSKTALYRIPYLLIAPFTPLLKRFFPNYVTTTEQLGRAMIRAVQQGGASRVFETRDINAL